ncbi:MAG: biopolymer transporter Tol [Bacteroidota bacterium]|nr:biopolymer transporter Tol [Bacteroidota bacterium]
MALLCGVSLPLAAQPDQYSAPEFRWYTIETKHFTVSYHEGAERTARAAAKIAEEIHGPITALYGHVPDTKVHIFIKDISDYSNGAAYFFNNKIEIWASPLDFELRGTHNWLRNVIPHEYTHIIQLQAAMKWGRRVPAMTLQWFGYEEERRKDVLYGFPNLLVSYPIPGVVVPPWLAEGTAQYQRPEFGYEHWDSHRDMILRCYVLSDSMLSWPEMSAFGKTSLGNESVYNAGYNLTRFIAATYGRNALPAITRALSEPFVFTVDAAIGRVLGISGDSLYRAWRSHLREDYARRIEPVLRTRREGRVIGAKGFGNLHPAFSPDGSRIAYLSTKDEDFFSRAGVYLYDRRTGTEEAVAGGVRSTLSWSPDGKKIVYGRYNTPSVYGHLFTDLYEYDVASRSERRLTHGLRASNPACSPDGKSIAFVTTKDGTMNVCLVDADGGNIRPLTAFANGEQVFTPAWAPDGSHLVFGYADRGRRRIARVDADGNNFREFISGVTADFRDPTYSPDGRYLYYVSDRTGIFNVYRYESATGTVEQVTNCIGGAFMPSVDASGSVAYAMYTADGYKLALLESAEPLRGEIGDYIPESPLVPPLNRDEEWDWEALRDFDDTRLPETTARPYRNIFQSMMLFPFLRVDTYNPDNRGLQFLKPGVMFFSSDILGRIEMMGSAAVNSRLERDLFASFTYRDRLPLLGSLGIYPDLSFDIANVTRKTTSILALPLDTMSVGVSFNLLEFAVTVRHNLFSNKTRLEAGYRHSRYTSTIGSFRNPDTDQLVAARDNLYLIGNNLHVAIRHHDVNPTRDAEINPTGIRVGFYYDFEFNRFNPNGDYDYDASTGMLVPRYTRYTFHRLEGTMTAATRIPGLSHTFSLRLRAGTILGEPVDEFFNFYGGGITGMQGYTYYALGGNELYHVGVTYRFPIIPSMDFRVGHILFDKLYGGVFYDAGDAAMRSEELTIRNVKQDVGFELRLESFSFSLYPTRVFFSGAYGLTPFTRSFDFRPVTYGKEWKWYVGVLFGFDLSDR